MSNTTQYLFKKETIMNHDGFLCYEILSKPNCLDGVSQSLDAYYENLTSAENINLLTQTFCFLSGFYNEMFSININRNMILDSDVSTLIYENIFLLKRLNNIDFVFEINENCCDLIGGAEFFCFLDKLKSQGVKFWIDDFGTGNTNLSVLAVVKFDGVKIDKELFWTLVERGNELLSQLVSFIRNFTDNIIIEGVETYRQLDIAYSNKCFAQGFLFNEPGF